MMPGSVNIFEHAGTGTHSTAIQGMVHYFVLRIAPYPNTSYQYYN